MLSPVVMSPRAHRRLHRGATCATLFLSLVTATLTGCSRDEAPPPPADQSEADADVASAADSTVPAGPVLEVTELDALIDVLEAKGPAHADLDGVDATRAALLETSGPVAVDGVALLRLGRVLDLLDRKSDAALAYNAALDALPSDDRASRAITAMHLGMLLADRPGNEARAIELTSSAAAALEDLHAHVHDDVDTVTVITAQIAHAHALARNQQIRDAFATLGRGTEIANAELTRNHPIRARLAWEFGRIEFMNRRFAEARTHLEPLYQSVSQALGASSPLAIDIAVDLALAMKRAGSGPVAVAEFLDAQIEHVSAAYGVDHPRTRSIRFDALQTNLMLLRRIRDDDDARRAQAETVRAAARAFIDELPDDSIDASEAWAILGTVEVQVANEEAARDAWKRAYDIRLATLGEFNYDTQMAYSGYGRGLWLTGDPAGGRAIIDSVIAWSNPSDDPKIKGLARNLTAMRSRLEGQVPSGVESDDAPESPGTPGADG